MSYSQWRLHFDTKTEKSAKNILNKCLKAMQKLPMKSSFEKYYKGGYMCTMEIYHYDELSWAEVIIDVIKISQRIGNSWNLIGDINKDASAVLSNDESVIKYVPGLMWAEWQIQKEE